MAKRIISQSLVFSIIFFGLVPFSISGDYGAILEIPYIYELPDYDYPNVTAITWQGGESKFGKWRNFFNGYEMGWGISYNSQWNYKDNTWEPRDTVDTRTSICSMIRFNVAEGNVGGNVFEINFAKGDKYNSPPDWNSAASYFFYDGSSKIKAPAKLFIHAPGNSDAMIQLAPNEGASPNRVNLRNAADGKFYIEHEEYGSEVFSPKYSATRTPAVTIQKGLTDINGALIVRSGDTSKNDSNACVFDLDPNTGDLIITIYHGGQVRSTRLQFSNMKGE